MNQLSVLVGQRLDVIDVVHDYRQLRFSDHTLNVYNEMTVKNCVQAEVENRFVVAVFETEEEIQIALSDGAEIVVNLRSSAWMGPEALALYRGGRCVAVWR